MNGGLVLGAVVVLVCVGAVGYGGLVERVAGSTASPTAQVNHSAAQTFAVTQNDTCYDVRPIGAGTETVEAFYGYTADNEFVSEGTTYLQENQVSNLFLYDGSEGYSLVVVHDQVDGPAGGTVSFTITGLPTDGEWVVEDDDYEGRDDDFDHQGSRSEIDWMWADGRTDGAAFRGLGTDNDTEITIEPGFNEAASAWGEWNHSGGDNRTEAWRLLGPAGTVTELNMSQPVTISPGGCELSSPVAIASLPDTVEVGETVRANATASRSEGEIAWYSWSFGDGTTRPGESVTHTYHSAGTYTVELTVVDADGNRNSTTQTVRVTEPIGGDRPADATTSPAGTATSSAPGENSPTVTTDEPRDRTGTRRSPEAPRGTVRTRTDPGRDSGGFTETRNSGPIGPDDGSTPATGPGFGWVVAIVAVGLAAGLRARRG